MLIKKVLIIAAVVFAGCAVLVLCLFAGLPHIVESQLKHKPPKLLKNHVMDFEIEKIGISNAYISGMRISEGLTIEGINIGYDFKWNAGIHLKKIIVSGLTLQARLDENNQIHIPGIELPDPSVENTDTRELTFQKYLPQRIVLKNARLIMEARGETFLIPLEALLTIHPENGDISVQATAYPFGERIDCFVAYDVKNGIDNVRVKGKSFDSSFLNPFVGKFTDKVHPKSKKSSQIQSSIPQLSGLIDFSFSSDRPLKKWDIHISRIGIEMPVVLEAKSIDAIVSIENDTVSASGRLQLVHSMVPHVPLEYTAKINLKDNFSFDTRLKTGQIKNFHIKHTRGVLDVKSPQILVDLNGRPSDVRGRINISSSDISFHSGSSEISFPGVKVAGTLKMDKNNRPRVSLLADALNGEILMPEYKTKMSGVAFQIPYHYPDSPKNIKGLYAISRILYNDSTRFSSSGKIAQTGALQFDIDGRIGVDMLKDAKPEFNATIGLEKGLFATLDFRVDPFYITEADIRKLAPKQIQTAQIDMTAAASGHAEYKDHKFITEMQVIVKDGNIHLPDSKLNANGIQTTIQLNDILALESVPGQMLTIDTIQVNKVKISDARIRFSIEDARFLLVENIKFKWCNGLVTTEAVRFPQEKGTYALSLYCDRLDLTQLLEQIGAFDADGRGTLNGRIPIVYSNGDIFFDNGFLFSTPGSGGKIIIENTDVLTAGIPLDSPQFAELDVAREALRDFNYTWAKLVFNSFEETLYVNMELDGKPSKIMPFEYKKEVGRFVRVDASSPGSHFQGIKLDVNLNLPFNDVMKFGNKLKSILNQ